MIKLIECNNKRSSLSEGRNFGFGFSILNKIGRNKYEAITPFTCCKDYFNDLVYVENTKKKLGKIYGFKHELMNLFDNKNYAYLGVRVLDYNNNNKESWKKLEECNELLFSNYQNLIEVINKFENYTIKSKSRTCLISKDNDTLILRLPKYWIKNGPLISLYTLFIRCFFNINSKDLNKNIKDIINNTKTTYISDDNYLLNNIKYFINLNKKDIKSIYNYKYTNTSPNTIHNGGINNWINDKKDKLKIKTQC